MGKKMYKLDMGKDVVGANFLEILNGLFVQNKVRLIDYEFSGDPKNDKKEGGFLTFTLEGSYGGVQKTIGTLERNGSYTIIIQVLKMESDPLINTYLQVKVFVEKARNTIGVGDGIT